MIKSEQSVRAQELRNDRLSAKIASVQIHAAVKKIQRNLATLQRIQDKGVQDEATSLYISQAVARLASLLPSE